MHSFDTIAQVQEALDALTDRNEPLAARLERLPGRKEARYGQLLVDVGQAPARALLDQPTAPQSLTLLGLARQIELLRGEVVALWAQVDALRGDTEQV
jgi:uncharacterized protein YceH (UPF0502 family)